MNRIGMTPMRFYVNPGVPRSGEASGCPSGERVQRHRMRCLPISVSEGYSSLYDTIFSQ